MNRQELESHLKQSSDHVVDILKAAELPLDLEDYNPEHVQLAEAIAQLVSTKQAKTFKEAGELHRKPQREAQLNEVVARHQIAPERIPEILKAMRLRPETLTDAQLAQFIDVCQKVQSGMDLADAVPKTNNGRAKKAAELESGSESGSERESQPNNGAPSESAIALAAAHSLTADLPEHSEASLRDVAVAAVREARATDISDRAAEIAVDVADKVDNVIMQMVLDAMFGEDSEVKPDPKRAAARVHEIRAQRGQR
jgi:hypothetical protein